ncbi:MAG: 2-C-methyl-D-erythritol 4-phosphate cytidylyltransferase [Bacteroidetes bacterium GWF2_43_63]|nr:MAG: 2-C-methyl-D-erythritol 4-phosphate cytidylyltransferase [Bacteroidetes bacterium GWE2_42_42]OFY55557.1 MAG: 2-C-methyl-D-erythritol 4-phosphate cytidylyltransferase [Bacteroidetes bacterium GWF2_43_63]HBG71569.1 2-C-methyl-D-erythritol 4-phosphate cytidylyltransferase [Bacteroidales bacterium]HCB62102.1 2-C-methyl-D-erythritol 4-phosphate cytidylyltransferase [Bacteroidales bacterium]HCY22330.1 2-C-methyl-D-erythritol 4-phosphate cytidylyltransferase [Bacteroidales bacterium]
MAKPFHIIVVAGGSGKRMNSAMPKQFLKINGIPVIAVTFNRMNAVIPGCRFTVVIAERDLKYWNDCSNYISFHSSINIAFGGPERFHSVRSGLAFVRNDEVVAIHDAVRPLFTGDVIRQGFMVAEKSGSAIPVIPLSESIREINGGLSKSADRSRFRLCQTPQFFQATLLLDAYRQSYTQSFTDDASVVESSGYPIRIIEGNPENIKITTPADLKFAEAILPGLT